MRNSLCELRAAQNPAYEARPPTLVFSIAQRKQRQHSVHKPLATRRNSTQCRSKSFGINVALVVISGCIEPEL